MLEFLQDKFSAGAAATTLRVYVAAIAARGDSNDVSFNCVGDLQALPVSESCTEFAPGLVKAFLRSRPGYVPKVLNTSFYSQVVVLQAFSPSSLSEGDDLHLLCPVRALKMYVDRSSQRCKSLQLLVCFGAGRRGLASRDAISLAYEVRVCLHL